MSFSLQFNIERIKVLLHLQLHKGRKMLLQNDNAEPLKGQYFILHLYIHFHLLSTRLLLNCFYGWIKAIKPSMMLVLTWSESLMVSCSETLEICWSLVRSSSQQVSQSDSGQSLCKWMISETILLLNKSCKPYVTCEKSVGLPRSLFQSLMRTFAKAMTSSSVQCFLIPFTDMPILVS